MLLFFTFTSGHLSWPGVCGIIFSVTLHWNCQTAVFIYEIIHPHQMLPFSYVTECFIMFQLAVLVLRPAGFVLIRSHNSYQLCVKLQQEGFYSALNSQHHMDRVNKTDLKGSDYWILDMSQTARSTIIDKLTILTLSHDYMSTFVGSVCFVGENTEFR